MYAKAEVEYKQSLPTFTKDQKQKLQNMGLDTKLLKTVLIWVMAAATTRSASETEIPQTIRADC